MDGLFVLYFVGGFAILLFFVLRAKLRLSAMRNQAANPETNAAIAGALGGALSGSEIRFGRGGRPCSLWRWVSEGSSTPVTTVTIGARAEGFFDAISDLSRRIPKSPPRSTRIREGNSRFRMYSTEPAWAEGLLDQGLSSILDQLHEGSGVPVHVQLTTASLSVEIEKLAGVEEATRLVEIADRVVALAASVTPEGAIEILDSKEETAGVCQVCSTEMDATAIRCPKCQTPHHRDCWEYLGRCSTFGCPGT